MQHDIETLLNKYWEGDTTLEEERNLKAYFAQPDIDKKWQHLAPLFKAFGEEKTKQMPHVNGRRVAMNATGNHWIRWAAAAILIGLLATAGTWAFRNWQEQSRAEMAHAKLNQDTFDDPQKAAEEIKAALALVSSKMNKGKRNAFKGLKKMEKVEKYFPKTN